MLTDLPVQHHLCLHPGDCSARRHPRSPLIAPVGTDHSIAGSFVDRKFTYFYNWCAGVVPRDSPPGSPPGIGCDSTDAVCQASSSTMTQHHDSAP